MPRENKKRGRRGEAAADRKRKHEEDGEYEYGNGEGPMDTTAAQSSTKRRKSLDDHEQNQVAAFQHQEDETMQDAYPAQDRPFFGMLDEQEQEYFRQADEILELNDFGTNEERNLFLDSVYREADGKELKLANSQSCSRLLERLIQLSTPSQLKTLFQRFSGNFIHLMSHRFASHCVEQLFTRAAPYVSDELSTPATAGEGTADEIFVSMENLYLYAVAELKGNMGFAMTDRFASHVLRILLLVLSGEVLESSNAKGFLASKKKETVSVHGIEASRSQDDTVKRKVPQSFNTALEELIKDCMTGLDTEKLRAFAIHPNASPVLQMLLHLELTHFGKQHAREADSVYKTLLPDDQVAEDNDSGRFLNGLVYDTVGSHVVEMIVKCAPGRLWKGLYRHFFRERLSSLARNEVAGYVVCSILERLGKDDLLEAHERIVSHIPALLQRNRTVVVRTLIERCVVREIDTQAIAVQIDRAYSEDGVFNLRRFLQIDGQGLTNGANPDTVAENTANGLNPDLDRSATPVKVHFNVLAQVLVACPGSLSALIIDSLVAQQSSTLLAMSKNSIASRTLQAALSSTNASVIQTRKLVQHFYGHIGEMAADKAASHVVDCIWEGTHGLAFIRERIAEELAENEATLRDSPYGRGVWKNWKMDIYKRRRVQWIRQSNVKASNDGFQSFSDVDENLSREARPKTALQLARERHVNKVRATQNKSVGTGANSTSKTSRSTTGTASVG